MDSQLLQQLRALVGRTLVYSGRRCRIIEILDRDDALVLGCEDDEHVIQGNQFGEATRRVRRHYTVALFDDQRNINPVVRAWLE
jgi:hypothetical protein